MQRTFLAVAVVAAALLSAPAARAQAWGNIKGTIVWGPKDVPDQAPITAVNANADKNHCLSKGPVLSEEWVVNKKNKGLRWTFVWLINLDPKDKADLPINPLLKAVPKKAAEIDQPVCAFIPHVLAIREGQELVAVNSSPVSHNIKWTGSNPMNQGNVTLPAGQKFALNLKAEKLPIRLECNIHPWMNGRVGVFKHPYFAVTDADGNFEIKDAPAGKYRLVVYNNAYNGGAPGRFGQVIAIPAGGIANLGTIPFMPPKE